MTFYYSLFPGNINKTGFGTKYSLYSSINYAKEHYDIP